MRRGDPCLLYTSCWLGGGRCSQKRAGHGRRRRFVIGADLATLKDANGGSGGADEKRACDLHGLTATTGASALEVGACETAGWLASIAFTLSLIHICGQNRRQRLAGVGDLLVILPAAAQCLSLIHI